MDVRFVVYFLFSLWYTAIRRELIPLHSVYVIGYSIMISQGGEELAFFKR